MDLASSWFWLMVAMIGGGLGFLYWFVIGRKKQPEQHRRLVDKNDRMSQDVENALKKLKQGNKVDLELIVNHRNSDTDASDGEIESLANSKLREIEGK